MRLLFLIHKSAQGGSPGSFLSNDIHRHHMEWVSMKLVMLK